MIQAAVLTIFLSLYSFSARAGGLECQISGTCQCLADGTCDKFGNPLPAPTSLGDSTIQCGQGADAFRVILAQPFAQMPREGKVAARFENISLPTQDFVTTSINPIFHMRYIKFQTAYCEYSIQIDAINGDQYYVFNAFRECEGVRKEIQCEI